MPVYILSMSENPPAISLREVEDTDLPVFFEQQLDEKANWMAAFIGHDPNDRAAFDAHWAKIMADPTVTIRTVVMDGAVAGSVLSYEQEGKPEVSYWLGREFWGRGIATRALRAFLDIETHRPLFARAAKDNIGSLRVLEKCGFSVIGEETGFARARGHEIRELVLRLDTLSGA